MDVDGGQMTIVLSLGVSHRSAAASLISGTHYKTNKAFMSYASI
jgi:hypothetical protein